MTRRYDYTGPLNADGHPVGCQCWTCYLGKVRIGDGWVSTPPREVEAPPPDDRL